MSHDVTMAGWLARKANAPHKSVQPLDSPLRDHCVALSNTATLLAVAKHHWPWTNPSIVAKGPLKRMFWAILSRALAKATVASSTPWCPFQPDEREDEQLGSRGDENDVNLSYLPTK